MAATAKAKRVRRPSPAGGLRYSSDFEKGLRRLHAGKGFEYLDAKGDRIADEETLDRIKSLAIPPAWTDVWICADERGHLQATGRDARGRKQYRYHPRWRELRDADKFDHLMEFARVLPRIRRRVREDIQLAGLPRRKVLALLVQLLERTCIRIGNERYAEENDSFGLTTMRNRHVKVSGARVEFQFRGKSGKFHRIAIDDPQIARIVRHCRDLPGQELFQYRDEKDEVQSVTSSDVNDYLKEVSGYDEISTKDFRTWNGSVFVASMLRGRVRRDERVGITHVAAAVRAASQQLGNTPAICRKSYVHPRVLDPRTWQQALAASRRGPRGLRAEEAAFLSLIRPLRPASRTPRPRRPTSSTSQTSAVARP